MFLKKSQNIKIPRDIPSILWHHFVVVPNAQRLKNPQLLYLGQSQRIPFGNQNPIVKGFSFPSALQRFPFTVPFTTEFPESF